MSSGILLHDHACKYEYRYLCTLQLECGKGWNLVINSGSVVWKAGNLLNVLYGNLFRTITSKGDRDTLDPVTRCNHVMSWGARSEVIPSAWGETGLNASLALEVRKIASLQQQTAGINETSVIYLLCYWLFYANWHSELHRHTLALH